MPKQSRFLCIGGFLNGTQVKDQGDTSFASKMANKLRTLKRKSLTKTHGIMIIMFVKPRQINKHEIGSMT